MRGAVRTIRRLACLLQCFTMILLCSNIDQQSTDRPSFEAASIKRSNSTETGGGTDVSPGRLNIENRTLRDCIQQAYSVKRYLIAGGAYWVNADPYDIVAKAEGPANQSQLMKMLQTLLEDRFKLTWHRELRSVPGYELVRMRDAPRFREATDDGTRATYVTRHNEFRASRVSMVYFANYLSGILSTPVIDHTGLGGQYAITLAFAPDGHEPADTGTQSSAPLISAIREQLGLKLEPLSIPTEMFIIDHAERPTKN